MKLSELPGEWQDYIRATQQLLGLGEWDIHYNLTDSPDGKDLAGCATTSRAYLRAWIDYKRNMDKDYLHAILMHELWHVAFVEFREAALDAINQLPEERREYFREHLQTRIEQTVERLTRSVQRMIPPEKLLELASGKKDDCQCQKCK